MGTKLVLPDTNILIIAFKKQEPYASFLRRLILEKKLVLSTVVIAEFLVGATVEQEKLLNLLISQFQVVSVDLAVAQLAAFYRKKYLRQKKKPILPDCFIAASAKIYDASLATNNKKDYPIKEIEIMDKF